MKTTLVTLLSVLLVGIAAAQTPWRTFRSADGGQTFVGKLIGFDSEADSVTVRMKTTQQTATLKLERLSAQDQEYVKATAPDLVPDAAIELRFAKLMELTGSEQGDGTRTKSYNGGYQIQLRNYSTEFIRDVDVEYIVIYRKDEVGGNGERVLHSGSKHFADLLPNYTDEVIADGVKLENYFKGGSSVSSTSAGCSTCPSSTASIATRAQKSRDLLLGCIVRIKIGGKVVLTDASSPDILRQYADAFSESK
jgi:hypothetical protein